MSWKPCDRTRIPWSLDCLYNVACLPVETNAGDDRQDAGPDAEARWWRGRRLKRWKWVRSFCDSCDPFVYFVASSESFICTRILFCGHKLVFARVLYWYAVAAIKFPSPVSWLVLHTEVLIIFFNFVLKVICGITWLWRETEDSLRTAAMRFLFIQSHLGSGLLINIVKYIQTVLKWMISISSQFYFLHFPSLHICQSSLNDPWILSGI